MNCRITQIILKETLVKKILFVALTAAMLLFGSAYAKQVKDWHDLDAVHKHVQEAINEMNRARAANHYDMAGHGAKAEAHLHDAERELHDAVEAAKNEK